MAKGIFCNSQKKNLTPAARSKYHIHISLQHDGANLLYYKLKLLIAEISVGNIKDLQH